MDRTKRFETVKRNHGWHRAKKWPLRQEMAVHSFGFDENYWKNISSVLQEKRFRFRCFLNELDIFFLKKKEIYSKTLITKLKAIGKSLDRTCYYNFGVHFFVLFSLSLASFFTARWLSLRFLRWFSPEPVSDEVPKRAEIESSSFLSPQKYIESTTFRWKFFKEKDQHRTLNFKIKIPLCATYANRSSKRIKVI